MTAPAQKSGSNIFQQPASNSVTQTSGSNPFAAAQSNKSNPFLGSTSNEPKPSFGSAPSANGNGQAKTGGFKPPPGPKRPNGSATNPSSTQGAPFRKNDHHGRQAERKTQPRGPPSEFANKIFKQLAKDGIKAPAWPKDPNALRQKGAMDDLRQAHRAYREKARKSLMKANLIDDPDQRRRLDEALPFKGICEEKCPEWEKIQRIVESGLWGPEGYDENGSRVPVPDKMIKRLARSAAGQEAALPMDVRSPAACRRTLDYLIDELIAVDDRLPTYHHFAWDRSRAIRIDLSMQTPSMSPDEIKDEIYCLETVVRFHATSAHLLARSWFTYKDYSEQQEVEQLSKALMTLKQRYKDCADMGIVCDNEAEFLSYYIVFFGWTSSLKDTVESWGDELNATEAIQTALCIIESMQNTTMSHGPLKPESPTEVALNAASVFFSIVASPNISYTMACIAEIHFGVIRQAMLKTIVRSYARPRASPKDITAGFLRQKLRFDTEDDAVAFVEQHNLEFREENGARYLFIDPQTQLSRPRVTQAFSHDIVERKRNERPFTDAIHETIYEDTSATKLNAGTDDDTLFVESPKESMNAVDDVAAAQSDLEDTDTSTDPNAQSNGSANLFGVAPAQSQSPAFGTSHGPSLFSKNGSNFGTTSTPPKTIFGEVGTSTTPPNASMSLFGKASGAPGLARTPETTDSAKKVTFGETSVKYIESRGDAEKSPSAGLFNFLNTNSSNTAPPVTTPHTNGASWFPTNAANPSAPKNGGGESIFAGSQAPVGSGFKFPGPSEPASKDLFGGTSPFGVQTPADTIDTSRHQQNPSIFATNSDSQPTTSSSIFSANPLESAPPPATSGMQSSIPAITSSQNMPTTTFGAPGITATAAPKQPSKKQRLDKIAEWFVCADRGLLHDLEEHVVEELLRDVWTKFVEMEEERRKKEEDEKSWEEARKFRIYSLSVKYFYRWVEIFRKRRVVSRIKMEKEKFRKWNAPENVAKREAAEQDAKKRKREAVIGLIQERAREQASRESSLRRSTGSQASVEDALLASGIFNGMRDPKATARQVAMDEDSDMGKMLSPSEMLYKQETRRREKHGLPPLNRLQQPRIYKEGSKSAKLRAQLSGKDAMSISTGSFRNSTLSSSYRSSQGVNSSRVSKTKKSRVSDPYWRLKANGMVQMPNGEYLHESLALPMLREGKRFRGLGDYGLPPSASASPCGSAAADDEFFEDRPSLMLGALGRSRVSPSPSVASNISSKRKRASYHAGDAEDEDLAAYRSEASADVRKRVRSNGSISNEPDLLAQMQTLFSDVQAERKRLESR
ncbi:hypothetical protein PFICI_07628 [Pestalotiopsis fici W106-1]|uniref:SAC3/GANP/THP3 conserved domain-containing protein n=1 Tax=Pestalotiopsis fici (strain W106-1 / CGMCC3.15140) TaxID=1229662 RepID=W3X253_PESFW|nr:uncharacterized protein PFICI_07628 [Pestalotiopsis fici W106-1]ETS80099.1 hypothetical protein PFICI_07628 [Pestalotiopsis fici W106-1]